MRDDLQTWLRVRSQIAWERSSEDLTGPIRGRRDGVELAADARDKPDEATRGEGMRAAWRLVQADAAAARSLGFSLVAEWQKCVLGRPTIKFRTLPAYAKGGRERYGLRAETPLLFEEYLTQATAVDSDVPLPARSARAYLDVCFFHPFDDGNGRAALLTLAFVLAREGIYLDEVGPLQIRRYADDPIGAASLARLVHVLATAAARRVQASVGADGGVLAHPVQPHHCAGGTLYA
ncbi:Fic family protein [Streptomyces sp. NPDC008313]|uniref:Fic family protein n=1 Tax=Streptomyces sp. NPDC008313 TaxID=3364826 RepID=UPI0036EFEC16